MDVDVGFLPGDEPRRLVFVLGSASLLLRKLNNKIKAKLREDASRVSWGSFVVRRSSFLLVATVNLSG